MYLVVVIFYVYWKIGFGSLELEFKSKVKEYRSLQCNFFKGVGWSLSVESFEGEVGAIFWFLWEERGGQVKWVFIVWVLEIFLYRFRKYRIYFCQR